MHTRTKPHANLLYMLSLFMTAHQLLPQHQLHARAATSAVTTGYMGGRFGNNLATYMKSKWIAYQHDLFFYYKPFKHSEYLNLHKAEQRWTTQAGHTYKNKISVKRGAYNFDAQNTLYTVDFYAHTNWKEMIQDKNFMSNMKNLMSPAVGVAHLDLPNNTPSVAVHVRTGGGYDTPRLNGKKKLSDSEKRIPADVWNPLMFPPDEYYIDQIKALSELCDDQPLHVHIFTDEKNIQELVQKYQKAVSKKNITWGYRANNNKHDKNVLDDFFGIMQCDYLIRPESSFSRLAELLGDHQLIITPKNHEWTQDTDGYNFLKITEAHIKTP